MQKFILFAATAAVTQAQGRTFRLALFDPQPEGPLVGCNLDESGQAAMYYTIKGTNSSDCLPLEGAQTVGATHYSFANVSGTSCLKAGCDEHCHVCAFYQGNCATLAPTLAPTPAPGGSGSGSGHPHHDALEETLSDEVLTCDTTISGRTDVNGLSYLGNPSPDQLLTLRVATAGAFTLDACTSAFSTVLRVYDLEGKELKTCTSCNCAVELEAGEYALLVEGNDKAAATAGAFDVTMQCGGKARQVAEFPDPAHPVWFNVCYKSTEDANGMFSSAFLFRILPFTNSSQIHDRGLCLLEPPSDRAAVNSIQLQWVDGTCDVANDKTRFQATVRAEIIDDNNLCVPMRNTDNTSPVQFEKVNVNTTSGEYNIKLECTDSTCGNCTVNMPNVLDRAACLDHTFKIYDTHNFNTCGETPAVPVVPTPAVPVVPPSTGGGKKSGAPVGAIVGSVIGALILGGGIFFVLRRRKLSRMNAYAVLQDDPAF